MSVHSAAETMRGLSRMSPLTLVALIALALALGSIVWPSSTSDMVRVRLAE